MIHLSEMQQDALIEISNIGMSKAAKQLSILLNSPIKITIPQISFMNIDELKDEKTFNHEDKYSFVSQMLSQDLDGYAALVFRREHANLLMTTIIGTLPEFTPDEVRACEREAMLEIGNIIITSCLSVIANMLSKKVLLGMPIYHEDKILPLLQSLCVSLAQLSENVIAITTELKTFNDKLSGHLFIILTEESAQILLNYIEELIRGK